MPDISIEDLVQQQAAVIRSLQEEMGRMALRLPPEEAPTTEPGKFYEFPRVVYRATTKKKLGVDHPGSDAKVVKDQPSLELALKDGWQIEPIPHVYPEDVEEAPAPKGKAAKR